MYFKRFRETEWNPTFRWVVSSKEAADLINQPHEDYPNRVTKTDEAIKDALALLVKFPEEHKIECDLLKFIHAKVFPYEHYTAQWRKDNVIVGLHRPPICEKVNSLMLALEAMYTGEITNIETLIEWYKDFETIHPFQDGNGRVGGVIVAVFSHFWHPEKGWYTAEQ